MYNNDEYNEIATKYSKDLIRNLISNKTKFRILCNPLGIVAEIMPSNIQGLVNTGHFIAFEIPLTNISTVGERYNIIVHDEDRPLTISVDYASVFQIHVADITYHINNAAMNYGSDDITINQNDILSKQIEKSKSLFTKSDKN